MVARRKDILSPKERSERMSRVRSKDTKPELLVRRLTHSMGYRYRLHYGKLPGRPDMVFPGRKKVIFVHGCFWHLHEGCPLNRPPRSRADYWLPKLRGNKERDARNQAQLREQGWDILVVWECKLKAPAELASRIRKFLDAT